MKKVHWLIEETNYQNDNNVAQRLMYLLQERGNPVTTFDYVFENTDWSFWSSFQREDPAVFFGTWNALSAMSEMHDLPQPLAWYAPEPFRCSTYYQKYCDLILQRSWQMCGVDEFERTAEDAFQLFGVNDCIFVRPDDNNKIFNGDLLKKGNLQGWLRGLRHKKIPLDETLMVIARPISIDVEWRFVVVGGKVAGGSQYKTNCCIDINANYDPRAAEFAELVAATWSPFPVFVVDVGFVKDEYKIVEIGPFNYAGLYKIELEPILEAIEEIVLY